MRERELLIIRLKGLLHKTISRQILAGWGWGVEEEEQDTVFTLDHPRDRHELCLAGLQSRAECGSNSTGHRPASFYKLENSVRMRSA